MRLLIVGCSGGTNIGESFLAAARNEGCEAELLEMTQAYRGPAVARSIWWHFLGRRPYHLAGFSDTVRGRATSQGAEVVLTTGLAPVDARTLRALRTAGIVTVNFLTDDPWNPAHASRWFSAALPHYDFVFTPRRANVADLSTAGCRRVAYMPFAYDEGIFYPDAPPGEACASDVFFAGGADPERVPYIEALLASGLNVLLYGNYWERHPRARGHARGIADPQTVRRGLSATKVGLCLVRRANRDGNSMRTFEVPAVGACPLVEDTPEHREIFGEDGAFVAYFRTVPEMVEKAKWLVAHEAERKRLAAECHRLITDGGNTYRHRLAAMLRAVRT